MKTLAKQKRKSVEVVVLADRISKDNTYIEKDSDDIISFDKFYANKHLNLCISAGLKNHKETVKLKAITKDLANRISQSNDKWAELKLAEMSAKGLNYGSSLTNMLNDAELK